MDLRNLIKELFIKHKKKRINLSEIEKTLPSNIEYDDYAHVILALIDEKIITAVISAGFNNKYINLPQKFTIDKNKLASVNIDEIFSFQIVMHNIINLSYYLENTQDWVSDKEYIYLINRFLKSAYNSLEVSTIAEVSYQICSDEKWILEKGGKIILERLKIFDKLMIQNEVDPCMFAINKNFRINNNMYLHLIVENKSIYYRLLKILDQTPYTTLIYGSGWKIVSSFNSFDKQFPFAAYNQNKFVYFGDLDREGIKIWHNLYQKYGIELEVNFYRGLLNCEWSRGKETQLSNKESIKEFCKAMNLEIEFVLNRKFEDNKYIPQEALDDADIKKIIGAFYEFKKS